MTGGSVTPGAALGNLIITVDSFVGMNEETRDVGMEDGFLGADEGSNVKILGCVVGI